MSKYLKFFGGREMVKDDDATLAVSPDYGVGDKRSADTTTAVYQNENLYCTDKHIGMKVVVDPKDASLDIVFVHGLMGNRDTTWTHANKVFWPRELAKDIPIARIMTFGYDADIVRLWGLAGSNKIRGHGKDLASGVSDRRRNCRTRPIIFIAHSLGGLVCEQALLVCGEGQSNLDVFKSTLGIIFMGTPHAGADLARWGYTVAKLLSVVRRTNSAVLAELKKESDVLTTIQQQFQQLLLKPGVEIEIFCFFESKPVIGVGLIVSEQSAALSQYPNQSIAANHMEMTKFSGRKDDGYQRVLSRVQDYIEVMEARAERRKPYGNCEQSSAATTVITPKPGIDQKAQGTLSTDSVSAVHQFFRTTEYERHKARNRNRVDGTCQWFLNHEQYALWRNAHESRLLWVSANPGCGKSVLAKYLVDNELHASTTRSTCYFFFKEDNEDQKTAANAVCALLHQLFSQKPYLLKHAERALKQDGIHLHTNFSKLWSILVDAVTDPLAGEVTCILDALDECRTSDQSILLEKLSSFYEEQTDVESNINLKFLVTSRRYQMIEREFNRRSEEITIIHLPGEDETESIRTEVDLVIKAELDQIQRGMRLSPTTVASLQDELHKFKHRTYLWLKLVFELIRQDLESVTKKGRDKIFNAIPDSVNAAYTAILEKSTDKMQAKKLLSIMCVATQPLTVQEISLAIDLGADVKAYKDLDIYSEEYSKARVRNLCGLFVSIIDGRVYLLHQTAKEFLMADSDLLTPNPQSGGAWMSSISAQDANFVLARICIWYLRLAEFYSKCNPIVENSSRRRNRDKFEWQNYYFSKYEFYEYAAENWTTHFRLAKQADDLIDLVFDTCSMKYRSTFVWRGCSEHGDSMYNTLSIASRFGHHSIVKMLLNPSESDVNACNFNGTTALWEAADNGDESVVKLLLAASDIDPNARRKGVNTPLFRAVSRGYEEIVRQLIMAPGIDANASDDQETALWRAIETKQFTIAKLVLEAPGINVNARLEDGRTALMCAAYCGYTEIIDQLLAVPEIEINAKDNAGLTALEWATYAKKEAVVQLLLAVPGINANVSRNYESPLECDSYGQNLIEGTDFTTIKVDNTMITVIHPWD